ncbi:uncharacterized protein YndB with AHSA1/START domain [Marmoricola sp. OAE513]|uniref:SRPBCC family protein n=1 Tax=Marmoricola sp. OAE513 TaxID=2817894 RepID=UPI001AE7E71A
MSTAGVVTITRDVAVPAATVWDVLSDGWLYPLWVVGAARMRDVDDHWPSVGAQLHHSVGNWPLLLDDSTEVLAVEPGRMITLKARGWPAGAAEVVVEVEDRGPTSRVHIREDAIEGPGVLMPRPLRQLAIAPRNREALRRLAFIAEGR